MLAWLDRWDLDYVEWQDWLQRSVAREQQSDEGGAPMIRPPDDEIETATAVEAICTGALQRWAHDLAERAAVALAVRLRGEAASLDPPRAGGILAQSPEAWAMAAAKVGPLDLELARMLAEQLDEPAIDRELSLHRLDWLAFECRVLRFADPRMAREAVLCVRDDGWTLERVATAARTPVELVNLVLADVREPMRSSLVGARGRSSSAPAGR